MGKIHDPSTFRHQFSEDRPGIRQNRGSVEKRDFRLTGRKHFPLADGMKVDEKSVGGSYRLDRHQQQPFFHIQWNPGSQVKLPFDRQNPPFDRGQAALRPAGKHAGKRDRRIADIPIFAPLQTTVWEFPNVVDHSHHPIPLYHGSRATDLEKKRKENRSSERF